MGQAAYGAGCQGRAAAAAETTPATEATRKAPYASASGPTHSWPTGIATYESSSSYEATRESTWGGTCSCSEVSQATAVTAEPSPATNAAPSSHGACSRAPRASRGSAARTLVSCPRRSRCRTTSRYISSPDTSSPTPRTLSTRPQVSSPLSRRVSWGPRICQVPVWARFTRQNASVPIHTQRIARNSVHPSRMSAARPVRRRGGSVAPVNVSRARKPAASRYVNASKAMAGPLPTATTSTPDRLGPRILVALRAVPSREFACWSRARSTSCGSTPRRAGAVNAPSAPFRNSSTATGASE